MEQLPADFRQLAPILIASMGPELAKTADNGLAPFFYLPHAHIIAAHGVTHFELGMKANFELTRRFTAEFSIRPFLAAHQDKALRLLMKWTADPNPHVRRLVSEGSRPRLPWAMRLPAFCQNPRLTLPLLEKLKDDPELYVRRSVANHLADILKDHAEFAYEVCERWVFEAKKGRLTDQQIAARNWIVRHAVRLPAKKEVARALKVRSACKKG